ncbi:hypothetical protein GCM10009560_79100 [Nonomuraea longicatena]|uniref:Uncharacterized protein n=1 Tax=Nonomuraea longicatena TaxID=83682 RepID=A0ABN1RD66_9ACTN
MIFSNTLLDAVERKPIDNQISRLDELAKRGVDKTHLSIADGFRKLKYMTIFYIYTY